MKKSITMALLIAVATAANAQLVEVETTEIGHVRSLRIDQVSHNNSRYAHLSIGRENESISYENLQRICKDIKELYALTDYPPTKKQQKTITTGGFVIVAFARSGQWLYIAKVNDRFTQLTRNDLYRLMDFLKNIN